MATRLDDLSAIHRACWQALDTAARTRQHPWRLMALATVAEQGPDRPPSAELRHVVLREVAAEAGTLRFFTDARSPKAGQLVRHPEATLLFWDPGPGWQLRARVTLSIETSGLAVSSRWARLKMSPAAQDYLSPLPPGTPLAHPLPERGTREHFAVVSARVREIDWLELHADGHRRALFDADGRGQWLTP